MSQLLFSFLIAFGVSCPQGRVPNQLRRRLKYHRLFHWDFHSALIFLAKSLLGLSLANQRVDSNYLTFHQPTITIGKEKPALSFSILTRLGLSRWLRNGRWLNYSLLLFASVFTQSNRQKNSRRAFNAFAEATRASQSRISRSASHSQRDGRNPVLSLRGI
jgi:hypothetical protein